MDVGVAYARGKKRSGNPGNVAKELDFGATRGNRKVYIESAYAMSSGGKTVAELKSLSLTGDSFSKSLFAKISAKLGTMTTAY